MRLSAQKALTAIMIGSGVIAATRLYYVQEMLAALAFFTVLFGCGLFVLLLGFTLDLVGKALLQFVDLRAKELQRLTHAVTGASGRRLRG